MVHQAGGVRTAGWLRRFRYGPMVTAFRNLESGQVVFSQTLQPQQAYIDEQFLRPNWQNKKPTTRRDAWRALAVAEMPTHEQAVLLYKSLVALREMRDVSQATQARAWRRPSRDGNIWFWNQFRPTYTHEAVADVISAIDALQVDGVKLHWAGEHHRGADSVWSDVEKLVQHVELAAHGVREQPVLLNELRLQSLARARSEQAERTPVQQERARTLAASGKPTHREIKRSRLQHRVGRHVRLEARKNAAHEAELAREPALREIQQLEANVADAERALRTANAEYDHFLPHGQRGAAKAPIKMRDAALRRAKRLLRAAKKTYRRRNIKRRVAQPRIRMRR